jgi:hypothetical protein
LGKSTRSDKEDKELEQMLSSFLAEGSPSGPRRQGFADAATGAPLTAPGRSQQLSAMKEERKEKRNVLDTDRLSHGRR